MRAIFILILLFISQTAFANFSDKVEVEAIIANRVKQIVKPVDNYAQVFVKVTLKAGEAPLAGTSLSLLNIASNSGENKVDFNDIESVGIKVLTYKPELPAYIEAEIKDSFSYENLTLDLSIAPMDSVARLSIENQSLRKFVENQSLKFIAYSLTGLAVVFLLLLVVYSRRLNLQLTAHVNSIVSALKEGQSTQLPHQMLEESKSQESARPVRELSESQIRELHHLSDSQLVALFSDCYWCEKDMYASWLWSMFSSEQRKSLINEWPTADLYSKFLTYIEPRPENYHAHPTYLSPLKIEHLSQNDLATWLKKNSGAWYLLSPLRQENCPLNIQEQLMMINSKQLSYKDVKVPSQESQPRKLVLKANFNAISLEDELAIWSNPDIVPSELKKEVPSLVWLAQCEDEHIKEVLSQLNAQQIASGWVGPEEVLSHLQRCIPEKKWTLLKSYLENQQASRNSAAFHFMFQMAFTESQNSHQDEVDINETAA